MWLRYFGNITGAIISDAPTPKPPIMRANTSVTKSGASADPRAEMAYKTAAQRRITRLPNELLSGPASIIASVEVRVSELTATQVAIC